MRQIDFKVSAGSGITGYWINVNGDAVALDEGQASVDLPVGSNYIVWWMTGSPRSFIGIVGRDGEGKPVIEVKKSEIPPSRYQSAGSLPFDI